MARVEIAVGLRVQVEVSGLQASNESAGVSVQFGAGPGMSARMTGTVMHIDRIRRLITVRLDGARIAGRDTVVVPPERIIAAV